MSSAGKNLRAFRLRACERCGGDAYVDGLDDEWQCLQCSRPVPWAAPGHARASAVTAAAA